MGRFLKITLDDQQRAALEQGYRKGKTHAFRQHCQIILLKAQGRKSQEIASLLGCNQKSVNDWLHRFKAEGIQGSHIKPGRGRKSILTQATDSAKVRQAVQQHRQRLSLAKAELEESLGKEFSQRTLVRFLKNLTAELYTMFLFVS
ncbi:MAG TPA: helix-turn-helix domain-containing protein [Blastocatellia bacterium]|jgi:transposase